MKWSDSEALVGVRGTALVLSICCLIVGLAVVASDQTSDGPCGEEAETADRVASDVVNPVRAIVSDEILTWRDWVVDGGFEAGTEALVLLDHPVERLDAASVLRTQLAAHEGAWGLRATAGGGQGILLAIRSEIEKGEQTRCSFWVRSQRGEADLRVSVLGVEHGPTSEPTTLYQPAPFVVSTAWTEIAFTFSNTRGVAYALLALDVGPNTILDVDEVAIEAEQWADAPLTRCSRTVGGITVPSVAVAPVHFNVLIHIEDPRIITQNEYYFREKTAVFTELARILHEHGGFLTIQPEEDWPMASLKFAPDTLSDLASEFGVVYSTHTHGPACEDDKGRLRSNQDCNDCRTCPGWESVVTDSDPYTPEYVGALRELLAEVSGTEVQDHNGNFHYENASALADVGISTWSAFKDHNTQSTFDQLFTNPWRPTMCDAIEQPELFQTHDANTQIIFVPGWGQAITRHPERLHERLAPMLSQVLRVADPDRVNSFYIVTHVDHYRADGDEDYITWDADSGQYLYGDAFLADLAEWETALSELIDPLVEEGYLKWTSLPEIGSMFEVWEAETRSE